VVGDPRQTIYSFTGATSEYLKTFAADFPSATTVRLVRDYRSTPQVVHVANRLMANDDELVAQRKTGPEPAVTKYADEEAEAAGVAAAIQALIKTHGVKPSEVAVLLRINAHMERFERALGDAKVPYVVRGAERFYDRPEVRQALVLIRGAARAAGAGTDATGLPGELPAAVRHVLASAGLTPEPARGHLRQKWESLSAIAGLADALATASPTATLAEFAAELAERAETGHAPVAAAVTLATMHAAKGLEWDAVLVPGLTEGIMPIVHARTAEAIEEERRLLYVAVTRARVHLALSWAPARAPGAESTRQRSRFLAAIQTPAMQATAMQAPAMQAPAMQAQAQAPAGKARA
jgi:DNA helicase-2/ATP-dependent DNA helicase PcrA